MIISGVSIYANGIFVSKIDPLVFALVRNFSVALILTGLLAASKKLSQLKSLTKKDWGRLVLIGVIGGGLPFALFFTGLAQIGAVNGNIIQKSLFIWVAFLAIPLLKEKVKPVQWLGCGVLFISMFLVGGTYKFTAQAGSWLVLTATILWALENIISKITLRSVSPSVLSWSRMVFGLPVLATAAILTGKLGLTASALTSVWPAVGVSAILLSVYMLIWYSALSAAPATLVSSILVAAPVVTALLGGIFQGKLPAMGQMQSLLGLSAGVGLVLFGQIKKAPFSRQVGSQ